MIQTLQHTICTAILWVLIALVAGYLVSHAPDLAKPLEQRMADAVNVR